MNRTASVESGGGTSYGSSRNLASLSRAAREILSVWNPSMTCVPSYARRGPCLPRPCAFYCSSFFLLEHADVGGTHRSIVLVHVVDDLVEPRVHLGALGAIRVEPERPLDALGKATFPDAASSVDVDQDEL